MGKKIPKFSVYKITINSNLDFYKMTDSEKKNFKKIAKYVFSNHIKKYVKFLDTGSIKNIEKTFRYEIGEVNNRLHLHGMITIQHTSKIQLDFVKLRDIIDEYNKQPIHLNIQVSSDPTRSWDIYMNKNKDTRKEVVL